MGVGLNTMLAAVGATGVAASKVASSFGSQISEANDGQKAQQMAQKSKQNKEAAIQARKAQRSQTKNTIKKHEAALSGQNKDLKTQIAVKEAMRDR